MTCWDILGIEPTGDLERIREAYERQMKFASDAEARTLDQAFREAIGDEPPEQPAWQNADDDLEPESHQTMANEQPMEVGELNANEAQIAREVVIQIKALMNDDQRQQDVAIWKAILCEPPADQLALRREVGLQLESRIRPMAENGAFPGPVAHFLGDWFEWSTVREANQAVEPRITDPRNYPESDMAPDQDLPEQPQMTNFWPAVIGWILGIIILATLFGGMGG